MTVGLGLSRRSFGIGSLGGILGGGAAMVSAGLGPAAAAQARGDIFDFSRAEHNLEAYIKIIGDLVGKPVIGMFNGHVFAVRDDRKLEAMFGFQGFGTGRYERQNDGTFHQMWHEIGVYRDLVSGRILQEWKNPLSGETVEVLDVQNDPVNMVLSTTLPDFPSIPDLDFAFGNYGHDKEFILPWFLNRSGNTASVSYDVHGVLPNRLDPKIWPRESTGRLARVSEMFQYTVPLNELMDPERSQVSYTGGWQRVAGWLPWMLMDGAPGHLMYRAVTFKLASLDELPADLRKYAEDNYPQFLTAPTQWTNETISSFDVYKKLRKPQPPRTIPSLKSQ